MATTSVAGTPRSSRNWIARRPSWPVAPVRAMVMGDSFEWRVCHAQEPQRSSNASRWRVATLKCRTHQEASVQVDADPLDPHCPSRQVLDRIGDRWSVLVIAVLRGGTKRYGELAATIGGISQKMLTQTLRGLERDGLVTR